MNRLTKTSVFVAGAVLLGGLAFYTTPAPPSFDEFSDQGESFYPDFSDPLRAASLEVIDYDNESGSARPFKVVVRDGRWSIPSHYDYPADGEERLANTAASMIDLERDIVQSDRVEDHAMLGVIDPLDDTTPALVGRGSRVTLRDESGGVLADFIIGDQIEGKDGFRYVRLPGKKRTYGVKLDVDLSTEFADWIDTKLLEIEIADLARIEISDYSINESTGSVDRVGDVVLTKGGDGQWTLPGVPEGKELDGSKITTMTSALRELKITGVRPKPPALTADLRATDSLSLDAGARMSLQSKGFFVSRDGRLLSNEGEVSAGTNKGVFYVLRFGEVFYGDGLAVSAGAEGKEEGDEGDATSGSPNRYLFVTAQFDETLLPPKPLPPAGYVEDKAAAATLPGGAVVLNVLTQEEGFGSDDAAPEDAPQGEPPADPSASDEVKRAAEAYEAALAEWEQKAVEGRELARTLNDRFAEWYYVIAGADFDNIRVDLESLLKEASGS